MNTETSTTAPKSAREAHERARAEAVAHSASGRRPLIDARLEHDISVTLSAASLGRKLREERKLKIRQKGQVSGINTRVLRKDGTVLDVDVSITVLKDERGQVTGSIGILRDTSNRILNEVKGINRVLYDVSTKPPASIEWE